PAGDAEKQLAGLATTLYSNVSYEAAEEGPHEAPPPKPITRRAFYKTWWFWTVVGVVVAGAVVAGVLAPQPKDCGGNFCPGINFSELPTGGETANHTHNGSINVIYQCDACAGQLPGGGEFVSVLDAIQGDGFNPVWEEQQITFNAGFAPRQLLSDTAVLDAAA